MGRGAFAIVLGGVKGRLRLFALDPGLRAMAALKLSGRGSHVPSNSTSRPARAEVEHGSMTCSEEIPLAFVRAARAFDTFGLRTRLRQDGDAFGALPLLL